MYYTTEDLAEDLRSVTETYFKSQGYDVKIKRSYPDFAGEGIYGIDVEGANHTGYLQILHLADTYENILSTLPPRFLKAYCTINTTDVLEALEKTQTSNTSSIL